MTNSGYLNLFQAPFLHKEKDLGPAVQLKIANPKRHHANLLFDVSVIARK